MWRLAGGLAVVERLDLRELVSELADTHPEVPEQLAPPPRRQSLPDGERRPGGHHCGVDVVRGAGGSRGEDRAVEGVEDVETLAAGGWAFFAGDDETVISLDEVTDLR